jgi:hypothetical protein
MLRLSSNAPALRKAVDARAALPAIETQDPPMDWLIWRKSLNVSFRSLAAAERWALDAAQRGERFPAMCEGICVRLSGRGAGAGCRLAAHLGGR